MVIKRMLAEGPIPWTECLTLSHNQDLTVAGMSGMLLHRFVIQLT